MWLLTRRVIALAELIGLPRAAMALATHQESLLATPGVQGASPSLVESWKQKVDVWDSICAIDRIASVMWSLPLATSNYALPKQPVVDSHGQVNARSYLFHLTDIASRILELENMYSSGRPIMELFNAVIGTDQELRSLSALPPKTWRKIHWESLSIDAILQYWHQYFTIRTHLQLALKYEEGQDFAFNFFACLEACQELARRYLSQRLLLPVGFFANRVIDLQVFTATVFLLLASYRTARGSSTFLQAVDIGVITGLVDQVVQMMEIAADRAGGDFARQAASACRSLHVLLEQPQTSSAQNITLNLALVGRIHVSRKSSPPTSQVLDERATDLDLMDSLSYSMEIPETYLSLTDEVGSEWLTWTGWDENG